MMKIVLIVLMVVKMMVVNQFQSDYIGRIKNYRFRNITT